MIFICMLSLFLEKDLGTGDFDRYKGHFIFTCFNSRFQKSRHAYYEVTILRYGSEIMHDLLYPCQFSLI